MPAAVVRGVPASFPGCVTERPPDPPLDVAAARAQHADYTRALQAGGFSVMLVDADDRYPDCCFVEDTAVVIDDVALLARPGHPSRRGEVGPVGEALRALVDVEPVGAPATLDGGDVLQVGSAVFVGVGGRTDRAGFEVVAAVARRHGRTVHAVQPRRVLHLKTAATALDRSTVLVHEGAIDPGVFDGLRVVRAADDDPAAANVVRLADGGILVSAAHRATAELVEGLGYRVVVVEAGEFHRADGGLTCLSVRLRR